MSRRFGRQQKRKLLAELAQVSRERDQFAGKCGHQRVELDEQSASIAQARRLLGEYCAMLPIQTRQVAEEQLLHYIPDRVPIMFGHDYATQAAALKADIHYFVAHAMRLGYKYDHIQREGMVRLHIGTDWVFGLALSRGAFRNVAPEVAAHRLAEQLAWFIVQDSDFLEGIKR